MNALATLIRVARLRAEMLQRELAVLEERRRALEERVRTHDDQVRAEQKAARDDALALYGGFAQAALRRRAALVAEGEAAGRAADALRATLKEAFVELKKLETLAENEAARALAEDNKREQAALDDIAGVAAARGR